MSTTAVSLQSDPKLDVFNVKGTSGVTGVVTIFPKESCSCPSTSSCHHILAVKLSLGAHSEKPSTRNLTCLRSKTRSKKDNRSGRKRPRPKDLDPEDQVCILMSLIAITVFLIYIYFLAGTAADARSNTSKSPLEGENKGTK